MKRTVLAAALGIVVSVAPSYGQGFVIFSNYFTTPDAIITTCPRGEFARPVDSSFTAGLFYQFGGGALTLSTATQSFNPATPGYFQGPIVEIPGYFGGPITFQVIAYQGADYISSSSRGISPSFTLPSIATRGLPVGDFGSGLKPFFAGPLTCVPEPSTVALVGVGLVSLVVLRSKNRKDKKD